MQHAHLTAPQLNDRIQQAIDRGDRRAALELRSPFLAAVKAEDESRARSARAVNKQLGVDVGNPVSIHYHPRDVKGHPKLTTVCGWYEVRRDTGKRTRLGSFGVASHVEFIGAIYLDGDATWSQVGDLIAEALRDMAAARDLDADTAMQVRMAAERRVHLQLREMGLLERS